MKILNKIDKFYVLMFFSLAVVAGIVIYTFRGIFSSIAMAYEVEVEVPDNELQINKDILDQAYEKAYESEVYEININ